MSNPPSTDSGSKSLLNSPFNALNPTDKVKADGNSKAMLFGSLSYVNPFFGQVSSGGQGAV